MTVLAVAMIVQARHHHRTTGTATGCRGKRVIETRAVGGNRVDGRRHSDPVAVTSERRAFVICDNEDHVAFRGQAG